MDVHWNGVGSPPIGKVDTIEDVGLDVDENLMRTSVKMIAERGKHHRRLYKMLWGLSQLSIVKQRKIC